MTFTLLGVSLSATMAAVRAKNTIKIDIESNGTITRQDIYELLTHSSGKKKDEKKKDVEDFLNSLPSQIKDEMKGGKTVKEKILDDLDSYPV